jgi:membrane protease YdiL (CAAX protease family)
LNVRSRTVGVLVVLALPVLLTGSTAVVFTSLARWLGPDLGYLLGFCYYWLLCVGVPLVLFGKDGFLSLFREESPFFRRENWFLITLLALTVVGAVVGYTIPSLANVSLLIVLFSPIAIVNGTCEEVLWRGTYVKAFRHSVLLACIYPALGFAISHISPLLVFPAEGGVLPFVLSTFFLGLAFGWVAYKTGTAKWTATAHSIIGLLAYGEPLSSSIVRLVFP